MYFVPFITSRSLVPSWPHVLSPHEYMMPDRPRPSNERHLPTLWHRFVCHEEDNACSWAVLAVARQREWDRRPEHPTHVLCLTRHHCCWLPSHGSSLLRCRQWTPSPTNRFVSDKSPWNSGLCPVANLSYRPTSTPFLDRPTPLWTCPRRRPWSV